MSDTPRCDAFGNEPYKGDNARLVLLWIRFAESLERELTQAKAELLKFKLWMENVPTDSQLDAKVPSLDGETGRELLRSLGA